MTDAELIRATLTQWESNFLRMHARDDFGMLRRELGGMRDRPATDKHYGEIKYEEHAQEVADKIAAKLRAAAEERAAAEDRAVAPAQPEKEPPMVVDDLAEVREWIISEGRFTKASLGAAFGFATSTVHRVFNTLKAAGLIRETDRREQQPTGGRPAIVWESIATCPECTKPVGDDDWSSYDDVTEAVFHGACLEQRRAREPSPPLPEASDEAEPSPIVETPAEADGAPDDREPETPAHLLGTAGEVVDHDGEPPTIAERIADRHERGLTIPRPGEGLERDDEGAVIGYEAQPVDVVDPVPEAERQPPYQTPEDVEGERWMEVHSPVWVGAAVAEAQAQEDRGDVEAIPGAASGVAELRAEVERLNAFVVEALGNVKTLDECRRHLAAEVSTLREELGREQTARAELAEQLAEARMDTAAGVEAIAALDGQLSDARRSLVIYAKASTEGLEGLAALVAEARAIAEAAMAQVDASGSDALDITLGAAVAGLAAIGRGELDPRKLVAALHEADE